MFVTAIGCQAQVRYHISAPVTSMSRFFCWCHKIVYPHPSTGDELTLTAHRSNFCISVSFFQGYFSWSNLFWKHRDIKTGYGNPPHCRSSVMSFQDGPFKTNAILYSIDYKREGVMKCLLDFCSYFEVLSPRTVTFSASREIERKNECLCVWERGKREREREWEIERERERERWVTASAIFYS